MYTRQHLASFEMLLDNIDDLVLRQGPQPETGCSTNIKRRRQSALLEQIAYPTN